MNLFDQTIAEGSNVKITRVYLVDTTIERATERAAMIAPVLSETVEVIPLGIGEPTIGVGVDAIILACRVPDVYWINSLRTRMNHDGCLVLQVSEERGNDLFHPSFLK